MVPSARISDVNEASTREDRDYVLYWMTSARRTRFNFGLDRAIEHAREIGKPLLVFEPLRCGYRWASDRLHRFVLDGMEDNEQRCNATGVRYISYVEPEQGAGKGLLEALAERACLVVTDEFPCFFLPRMVEAAGRKLDVKLEQVDSNGIVPLRATPKAFPTAHSFRRWLQRELIEHLDDFPKVDPLRHLDLPGDAHVAREVLSRWSSETDLSKLPIDHDVAPVDDTRGGSKAASKVVDEFLDERLKDYAEDRNQPQREVSSGLSPYLHFGHVSPHEVFKRLADQENWKSSRLEPTSRGAREGWWKMSDNAESFLDELITWRELGYVFAFHRPDDYDEIDSLPDWAQETIDEHRDDDRENVYTLAEFETARTHDELWNAAQNQLVREGRIHNYLRMLWGKKIYEWSETPEDALDVMIELNNKYALDGRNPNSYSGIFWVLGRFDRAWGPERDVYGKLRYMSSENTAKKVRVRDYVEEYG